MHRIKMHAVQFQFAGLQWPYRPALPAVHFCPLPDTPAMPTISPCNTVKVDLVEPRHAQRITHHQALRARRAVVNAVASSLNAPHVYLASHHGLRQAFNRCPGDGHFRQPPAPGASRSLRRTSRKTSFSLCVISKMVVPCSRKPRSTPNNCSVSWGVRDCGGFVQNQHLSPTVQGL